MQASFKREIMQVFFQREIMQVCLIRNSGKSMLRHEAAAKSSFSFLFIKNKSVTISRLTY